MGILTYGPGYAPIPFREGYCKESVHETGRGVSFYQCRRKAVRDGYCKQHHPDAVKTRREAADKRYEEQQARSPYHLLSLAREEIKTLKAAVEELATVVQGEANREGSVYLCEIAKKYGKPSKWEEEEPEQIECDECGKAFPVSEATLLEARDSAGELEQVHLCRECAGENEARGLET